MARNVAGRVRRCTAVQASRGFDESKHSVWVQFWLPDWSVFPVRLRALRDFRQGVSGCLVPLGLLRRERRGVRVEVEVCEDGDDRVAQSILAASRSSSAPRSSRGTDPAIADFGLARCYQVNASDASACFCRSSASVDLSTCSRSSASRRERRERASVKAADDTAHHKVRRGRLFLKKGNSAPSSQMVHGASVSRHTCSAARGSVVYLRMT